MKYLLLLSLLLTACAKPKFQVGDCTRNLNVYAYHNEFGKDYIKEDKTFRRILKIGKRNYFYRFADEQTDYEYGLTAEQLIKDFDSTDTKVQCPEWFK